MEQLLLPVRAAGLRAWGRGRQVGRLVLEEVGVSLSVGVCVHPATQAAVRRLGCLLLLRRRRSYRHVMERCVDCGSVLYLLMMMVVMMMLSLHTIAMMMVQAGVQ